MDLIRLATYPTLTEAHLVRAKLGAHGIDAAVEADVGLSSLPNFERAEGVRVLVREADLAAAQEALERMLPSGGTGAVEA